MRIAIKDAPSVADDFSTDLPPEDDRAWLLMMSFKIRHSWLFTTLRGGLALDQTHLPQHHTETSIQLPDGARATREES